MKKLPRKKISKTRATARTSKRSTVKSRKAKTGPRATSRGSAHDIKALVRRWFEELWNQRNPGILDELLDAAAIGDTEGGRISGREEFIQKLHSPLIGAFPDLRVTLDDIIADGDSAAVRWTFEATHGGDTLGIPASNRRVKVSGMSWIQSKNGRLVAGWDRWNSHGLMSYLKDGTKCATVRDCADV